jgi:excinuclease ABC subunit C
MTRSALDGVPGLGEGRRKKLLREFGSVKRIREAGLDQLKAVPGIPASVAEAVHAALHGGDPDDPGRREAV